MWALILGLIIFLGIHSVRMVAPGWRAAKIQSMGDGAWKGLYTVFSLVGFALIVWGFATARSETEFLYLPPEGMIFVTMFLMLLSFILLAAGNLPMGYIKKITAHPMITGVIIWAFAHLLMNGDTVALLLFGVLLIWAIWNRISASGREPIKSTEPSVKFDLIAVVVGIVFWLAFVFGLHSLLIGVEVIA